jgi:hypothetical protein
MGADSSYQTFSEVDFDLWGESELRLTSNIALEDYALRNDRQLISTNYRDLDFSQC